jgi:predicted DNA-binding transcriptional regulator AlpA
MSYEKRPRQRAAPDPVVTELQRELRLLTPPEAALVLGVSERQLSRMRERGTGPEVVRVGNQPRYSPAALREWLAAKVEHERVERETRTGYHAPKKATAT